MTMRIRTVLADDEPLARSVLRELLQREADFEIVGEASNGDEALRLIEMLRPDAAILDIRMPGLSGVEILRRLEHRPLIVFATAYESHAISAFELQAVDYLLKPFGRRRFSRTAQRIRETLAASMAMAAVQDRTEEALAEGETLRRILVRERGGLVPVLVQDIDYISARDDYAELHVGDRTFLVGVRMKHLEKRLDQTGFVRIHRSHIVNLGSIREIRLQASGGAAAELQSGISLPVSRAGLARLRASSPLNL